LSIVEALAVGLPVIASRHGSAAELVQDEVTGFLFGPGDANDLVAKVQRALAEPGKPETMRALCRQSFIVRFSAEANYESLMRIYDAARRVRDQGSGNRD
jgi:glycosyltransferase involved in cell wall biosynthesis